MKTLMPSPKMPKNKIITLNFIKIQGFQIISTVLMTFSKNLDHKTKKIVRKYCQKTSKLEILNS